MSEALIYASGITLAIAIVDIFRNKKTHIFMWIFVFIVSFIFNFFVSQNLQASEFHYEENCCVLFDSKLEINHMRRLIDMSTGYPLSAADRKYYEEKVRFHLSNGKRCYDDAKNICWYLPRASDRDAAEYCFSAALGALMPGEPISKMIAIILATAHKYGLDAMAEWRQLHNKLYYAHYHYDLAEFYQEVLNQG